MNCYDAFAVPVFHFNAESILSDINYKIFKHQEFFNLHERIEFNVLVKFIEASVKECFIPLGIFQDYEIEFTSMWINIMNPHRHTNEMIPHTHDNNFLSGVFYTEEINSPLVFQKPWISNMSPNIVEQNKYNSPSYFINPAKGDLIIFPSYLLHHALLNTHVSNRISIAWNIILRGFYGNHPGTKVKL